MGVAPAPKSRVPTIPDSPFTALPAAEFPSGAVLENESSRFLLLSRPSRRETSVAVNRRLSERIRGLVLLLTVAVDPSTQRVETALEMSRVGGRENLSQPRPSIVRAEIVPDAGHNFSW